MAFAKRALRLVNDKIMLRRKKMCTTNLITSWAFKVKPMNDMAPCYIANAIPGLSHFLWRAELYKNFKFVKTASNNNLIEAVL